MKEMDAESKRLAKLQARMLKGLQDKLPEIYVNGDLDHRIPGNLNISFAYVEGESLMMGIKGLSVSSGSACTSASLEPSYVLRALGVDEELAHTSLRIGLGRFTTEQEVDTAVEELVRHVNKLREMSPLWEMAQEGIDLKSIEWAAH
jgi:cysteine desulfurase